MFGFSLLRPGLWVASLLLVCGCATAGRPTELPGTVGPAASAAQSAPAADTDCFAMGDVKAREQCFSRQTDDEIAECERVRLYACKPYRDMHRLDQEVAALSRELQARAQKQYASYTDNDADYLRDLSAYLSASDKAWAASRDADCLLEPFAQGMSRREAGDLTEVCRVARTQARMAQIKALLEALK